MTAITAILCLCAQVIFIQNVLSQCMNRGAAGPIGPSGPQNRGWNFDGSAYTGKFSGPVDFAPSNGGALPVTSASPISPTGVSLISEGNFEGLLTVVGEMPFLGTAALEGVVPTRGGGAINYGCGSSDVGMVSESSTPALNPFGSGLTSVPEFGFGRSYFH